MKYPSDQNAPPQSCFLTSGQLLKISRAVRLLMIWTIFFGLFIGTLTSINLAYGPTPANGSYPTFITNDSGNRCSAYRVAIIAPTAATVSVSGRVTTPAGRGIIGVRLSLTDSSGEVRTATTTSFGYYRFDAVQAGGTYILSATSKHYTFSQPMQVLKINEETTEVNFIANSEKRLRSF